MLLETAASSGGKESKGRISRELSSTTTYSFDSAFLPLSPAVQTLGFVGQPLNKTIQKKGDTTVGQSCPLLMSKRVKRGFRSPVDPKSCGVMFESVPAWLWAIRLSEVSKIFLTHEAEMVLRTGFETTWAHFRDKLVVVAPAQVVDLRVDVWLISGSQGFIDSVMMVISTPVVVWLFPWGRRKPAHSGEITWTRVSHSQVGGVTNISSIFGVRHLVALHVPVDPISRNISHILKHSERPVPCAATLDQPHYSVSDRLSIHHLDRIVLMPTSFSRTGWGQRCLLASELGHAFELPPYVSWNTGLQRSIVPIEMLRVVVDSVFRELSAPPGRPEVPGSLVPILSAATPDGVFLAELNRWLPGSWAEAEISDRAVKADNAQIDYLPWHRRITLVFPSARGTLAAFESMSLRLWRRALYRSFLAYLRGTYGSDWATALVDGRQSSRKRFAQGDADADLHPVPHPKRQCVGIASVASAHIGGSTELEKVHCPGDSVTCSSMSVGDGYGTGGGMAEELRKDVELGCRVLAQVLSASWWDWTTGSSLIFWRWNGKEQIRAARDGMEIFIQSPLPQGRRSKVVKLDPVKRQLVADKLEVMLSRSYLEPGFVSNALHFFAVPKGEADIRVVFDGTSSGLNDSLWAPNFYLPTAKAAALHISFTSWMSDMDCGEMFHNFFMDRKVRKCAGIQVEKLVTPGVVTKKGFNLPVSELRKRPEYLRWARLFMGMRPSTYNAVRHYYWAEEFARGDPNKRGNPMAFDKVILNLPGMDSYDPQLPKVMKWNSEARAIAGDVITFVDDIRITGFSKENCRNVYHQFASRIQFLGMQDAPRKFRPPSQAQAGAWTGTIFRITPRSISKSVSEEKWQKGIDIVNRLDLLITSDTIGRPMLNRKLLERETGFLNHLAMTFENLLPYLKGFYLTLNSWRAGRDAEDWKVSDKRWIQILEEKFYNGVISEQELALGLGNPDAIDAPDEVKASPRMIEDIRALKAIFSATREPPQINLRSTTIITVVYGFGDASGSGLGATFTCGTGFSFRIGVWGALVMSLKHWRKRAPMGI